MASDDLAHLSRQLLSGSFDDRRQAARALTMKGTPEAAQALALALRDENRYSGGLSYFIADCLADMGESGVEQLERLAADAGSRPYALAALERAQPKSDGGRQDAAESGSPAGTVVETQTRAPARVQLSAWKLFWIIVAAVLVASLLSGVIGTGLLFIGFVEALQEFSDPPNDSDTYDTDGDGWADSYDDYPYDPDLN